MDSKELERKMEEEMAPYLRNIKLYGEAYPGAIQDGIDVVIREQMEKKRQG